MNYIKTMLKVIKEKLLALYYLAIHFLVKTQCVSRFFAHGGLQTTVLIFLTIFAVVKCSKLEKSNVTSFSQLLYTFYGDTLHNYKLNYLYLEKDLSRLGEAKRRKNDIVLTHGFVADTLEGQSRKIKVLKTWDNQEGLCDLVSKIHFVKVDNREVVYKENPYDEPYKYLASRHQLMRMIKISDHDRYYYSYSQLNDSQHVFYRVTHLVDTLKENKVTNPFSVYWIGVQFKDSCIQLNPESQISITYNKLEDLHSETGIGLPLQIESISPEPTERTLTAVVYKGEELQKVIKQGGVFVTTLDPIMKSNQEQEELLFTVILGAIIAFIFDIIVEQILKWRKLKE